MKQAIAGVVPPQSDEVTMSTVWPGIAASGAGRLVGRLAGIRVGIGSFFTVGKLMALATIPISLSVYLLRLVPGMGRRYTITNRRIVVRRGLTAVEERAIELDAFDAIDVELLPGQQWLRSGELIFRRDGTEVFRLSGVVHPEPFRQACLKARTAWISVRDVLAEQEAPAQPQPA